MVVQTLSTKVLSVVAQIVIAWYLDREDIALYGLALAVGTFPSLLRDAGLQQLLVQRHLKFRRWATPVFWLSLTLGLLSGLLLAVIAPLAARFYNAPSLRGLIWVLAIGSPLTALATVPGAKVQADLRFKLQAWQGFALASFGSLLQIILAKLHFGPYSLILAMVLQNISRTAWLWIASPVDVAFRFQISRWKYLLPDSGVLLTTLMLAAVVAQGDFLVMGHFQDKQTLGIFIFAFGLSLQTLSLLLVNMGGILFPALSKLQLEPRRQTEAFLSASRAFAAIAVPLGLIQAAGIHAGIHLLFKPLWYPAIPVLEVLSVTMAIRSASICVGALVAAQNRIRFNLLMFACNSVVFLSVVAVAAKFGGNRAAVVVAFTELFFFAVSDSAYMYLVLRMNGRSFTDFAQVYVAPFSAGGIAAVAGYELSWLVPANNKAEYFLRLIVVFITSVAIYVPLLRLFAKGTADELLARSKALVKR